MDFLSGYFNQDWFAAIQWVALLRSGLLVLIGIPLTFMLSSWIRRLATRHLSAQRGMIYSKALQYFGVALVSFMVLNELGFQLGPLLGAAGIFGIAIGFASQTSVSNVISGLFLIAEQPFVVGDIIQVGTTVGEVLSIDTLSVKLRTFENQFIRLPNENILKSEVTNLTRFPIRRVDLRIGVAYRSDLNHVQQVLLDVAAKNMICLEDPQPQVFIDAFGTSSIDLRLVAWLQRADFITGRNQLYCEIKQRFEQEKIEIPFPQVAVQKAFGSEPLPVVLQPEKDE